MSQQSNPATLREALTKLVANWRAEHGRYPIKGCGSCADELNAALAASGTEAAPDTCACCGELASDLRTVNGVPDLCPKCRQPDFAQAAASPEGEGRETATQQIAIWLQNEADKRMKDATAREESAKAMQTSTTQELRAAKRMAEQMAGRKLPLVKTSVEDAQQSAKMDSGIATKLRAEAAQLSTWAAALRQSAAPSGGDLDTPSKLSGSMAIAPDILSAASLLQVASLRLLLFECIRELEYVQCVENCNSGLCATSLGEDLVEQGIKLLGVADLHERVEEALKRDVAVAKMSPAPQPLRTESQTGAAPSPSPLRNPQGGDKHGDRHIGWVAGHCSDPMNCPVCKTEGDKPR